MDQDPSAKQQQLTQDQGSSVPTYYAMLDLPKNASLDEIRQAYRAKSKLYHPDTTTLPLEESLQQFQNITEAYNVLSDPQRRTWYDSGQQLPQPPFRYPVSESVPVGSKASGSPLDLKERPLSPGELFALFILGLTFTVCLILAIVLGMARGEMVLKNSTDVQSFLSGQGTVIDRAPPTSAATPPVDQTAKRPSHRPVPQSRTTQLQVGITRAKPQK